MKKIFIKILSLMFMFGALSTSAIAVDKLHFVCILLFLVALEGDGMDVLEVPERL